MKLTLRDTINDAANISDSSIKVVEREFLFDFNDVVGIFSTNHKKVELYVEIVNRRILFFMCMLFLGEK